MLTFGKILICSLKAFNIEKSCNYNISEFKQYCEIYLEGTAVIINDETVLTLQTEQKYEA